MARRYDNFTKGQISGAVTAGATTFTMATGHGARFAGASTAIPRVCVVWEASAFDDPQDAFNDSPAKAEIVHQTARSGDSLTVIRAQEGTTGLDMTDTSKTFNVMGVLSAASLGAIVEFVNVVGYGATGDGATDDTTAVTDAFNAVADGGTVFFPVGNYNLASWPVGGLNLAKRFKVIGEEESILTGPAGSTFLTLDEEVTLSGLHFSGFDVVLDLDGIATATTIERVRLEKCRIDGAVTAVEWDSPASDTAVVTYLDIRDNEIVNCTAKVINIQGVVTYTRITDNYIDGGTEGIAVGNDTAADENDWRRMTITGNTIRNISSGTLPSAIHLYGADAIVADNIIDGLTGAGSNNLAVWVVVRRCIVSGNSITGVSGATFNYGIAALGSDRANTIATVAGWSVVIKNNVIDMAGGQFGIFLGVEDCLVEGNVVEECITGAIQTQTLDKQNKRVSIRGNVCLGGGASSAGVNLTNATDHLHVKDNLIEDHAIAVSYAPNAATVQAYAPKDIQICGNTLIDGAVGTHGIKFNPNTTNVTGTHTRVQVKDNYVEGMSSRWLEFTAGTYSVVVIENNALNGNGSGDAALYTVTPSNLREIDDGPNTGLWRLNDAAWNGTHPQWGAFHLWVDATGDLRIKSGAPTGDTDGTVVGTQT